MSARARAGLALVLACSIVAGPLVPVARAAAGPAPVVLENTVLKRTNQGLSILLALLKLLDEIVAQTSGGNDSPTPPPPMGTGHPGPGPLPLRAPDVPPADFAAAAA